MFTYVLAALVGFTIFIYVLASFVADNTQRDWLNKDPEVIAAISARLTPVGRVALQGADKVVLEPAPSAVLTFLEPPPGAAHGDGHGGDAGHGDATSAEAGGDHSADEAGDAGEETMTAAVTDEATTDEAGSADGEAEFGEASDAGGMVADLSGIDGNAIYNQGCNACHGLGIAGAPKTGDGAAWEPRVAQGREVLYDHAINGWNTMPAKGGFTYLSDEEVMAAVNYMVDQL